MRTVHSIAIFLISLSLLLILASDRSPFPRFSYRKSINLPFQSRNARQSYLCLPPYGYSSASRLFQSEGQVWEGQLPEPLGILTCYTRLSSMLMNIQRVRLSIALPHIRAPSSPLLQPFPRHLPVRNNVTTFESSIVVLAALVRLVGCSATGPRALEFVVGNRKTSIVKA